MIDPQRNHEARAAHTGCVAVRVRADGRVSPVDARAGVDLLRRLDPLAAHGRPPGRSQVQDGVDRILHPAPYAEAGFRLPGWLTDAGRCRARVRAPALPAPDRS